MKQFLKDQDALGATPGMTYKTKESFGTVVGGCLSCCVTIFVLVYVGLVVSAYIIGGRDYDQSTLQKYQPVIDPAVYNLT